MENKTTKANKTTESVETEEFKYNNLEDIKEILSERGFTFDHKEGRDWLHFTTNGKNVIMVSECRRIYKGHFDVTFCYLPSKEHGTGCEIKNKITLDEFRNLLDGIEDFTPWFSGYKLYNSFDAWLEKYWDR